MRILNAKFVTNGLLLAVLPALALTASAKPHPRTRTHASVKYGTSSKLHKSVRTAHATAGMPTERATEIQEALIKKGYLSGEPTGSWDAQTSAAMSKLQGDNGWQTKVTPDSRALIKLGLGPQPEETVAAK